MQTAAFLRRGGFELRFAGFLRRFDGSEPGTWQWGRWILGQIQWKIIYEVWGAVLVALHKPQETAPFSIPGWERWVRVVRPSALRGMQKRRRKSIKGLNKKLETWLSLLNIFTFLNKKGII